MTYITLGVALVALFIAWRTQRKNLELKERIGQVNSRTYTVRRELDEAVRTLNSEIATLKYDLLSVQGQTHVTGDMTIEAITRLNPKTTELLAAFHIGGCSSCTVDDSTPLGIAAAQNNQPLKPMLVALNNFLAEEQQHAEEAILFPNVTLEF